MPERSGLFFGRVVNYVIKLENRNGFGSLIRRLNNHDIDLALGKHVRKRSTKQNAYYHAVVVNDIAEVAGYLPDEAHDALKQMFLTDRSDDNPLPRVRSTKSLTTVEFSEYVDKCVLFAAEFYGIVIEDPISWENRVRLSQP